MNILLSIFVVLIVRVTLQVALGDMAELVSSNYNADKLPPGKLRFDVMRNSYAFLLLSYLNQEH